MRQFSSTGFRIWNLAREAKLVYSFFGLFSLAALASSVALYEDMVGPKTPGIGAYYNASRAQSVTGNPSGARDPSLPGSGPGAGGPEIAIPDEELSQSQITVAVSYRKLLEVTHFHLFTLPVFFLIITHLFMLTGASALSKKAWIVAGWLSALLHLVAPWAVHYGGAGYGWLFALSGGALAVTSLVLTVYPIVVMWTGAALRGRGEPVTVRASQSDESGS